MKVNPSLSFDFSVIFSLENIDYQQKIVLTQTYTSTLKI